MPRKKTNAIISDAEILPKNEFEFENKVITALEQSKAETVIEKLINLELKPAEITSLIVTSRKRGDNENFLDYKKRLKMSNLVLKYRNFLNSLYNQKELIVKQ